MIKIEDFFIYMMHQYNNQAVTCVNTTPGENDSHPLFTVRIMGNKPKLCYL